MATDQSNARRRLSALGNGLLNGIVLVADSSSLTRMREIENEIDALQAEYEELNAKLSHDRQRPTPYTK